MTVQRQVSPHAVTASGTYLIASADEKFRILIESVKDYAIFMLDREGRIQSWNAGAEIIKGYGKAEIVGKHISVFYTAKDRQDGHPERLLAAAVNDGRVEDEGWRVRKDGTRFWADVVITALLDPAGEILGFVKVTRDLTERRRMEEERRRRDEDLLRGEERFRLLIDAVEDYAIFMLDPQGRVATWNSGAERLKGYKASQIIGAHFSRFRVEQDLSAVQCAQELQIAAREGKLEEEGWRVRKDGSQFWANVVLTAIRNPSGDLLGFAKVTRDLTDRRRLDDERVHRARAEEAVHLREEFLSIASHELKTPLTTVQIDLQGLQESVDVTDEKMLKRVRRAVRNADRLAALVESLLDVSRIASGKLTLKPDAVDLSQAVSNLVDSMRETAVTAGCDLSFTTAGPLHGQWDRLRLEQVVLNLISNALRYGAGGPVMLSVSTAGGDALIEVTDAGPGIPDGDLTRIFGRFERAAPLRHYAGLGLGLYVSREIVEAHGGAISARNLPAGGASFVVRLPIAAPERRDETLAEAPV